MLRLIIIFSIFLYVYPIYGQIIIGKVIDSDSQHALEYVSIGVPGTSIGTISDEEGNFKIDVTGLPLSNIIKFSLISYGSQSFKIEELCNKENFIKLESVPTQLSDVIVKPNGNLKIIGNPKFGNIAGGWPGTDYGKGHECGIKFRLGSSPVKITSMHFKIALQSFDTSIFRLHVRSIDDRKNPGTELLNENIIFKIPKNGGIMDIDLSNYNLIFKGDVVISFEWIKVIGLDENKLYKYRDGTKKPVVYLYNNKKGATYVKRGVENNWFLAKSSLGLYLTVQAIR